MLYKIGHPRAMRSVDRHRIRPASQVRRSVNTSNAIAIRRNISVLVPSGWPSIASNVSDHHRSNVTAIRGSLGKDLAGC
jgi:hypothetical protein